MIGLKKLLKFLPSEELEAKRASAIHYAAYIGDLTMLLENISCAVADINMLDESGRTPLHIAVTKDNAEIVEALLKHGSDHNVRNTITNNYTSMHMAKSSKIAELLIGHGADINSRSSNGDTPVHTSTRHYCVDVFNILIKNGASVNVKNDFGMSPLHLLCEHMINESDADIEMVKLLIQTGIDLNAENVKGKTALHYLAQSCDAYGLISLLVSHGARLDVVDMKGYFPIHYFLMHITMLSKKDPKDVLKLFIPSKESTSFTDFQGKCALHYLTEMMKDDLIQFMIAEGGDVSIEDNADRSLLHYMSDAPSKAEDVVLVLVTNGVNVNAQDAWGRTPLIVAVDKKSKALTESLIRHGANVNVPDKLGNTALHIACYRDAPGIIEMLLAAGGNIHALDINRTSPLHAAAYADSLHGVEVLVKEGVDCNAVDAELRTPLDIAIMQRHFDVICALSWEEAKYKRQTVELTNVCNELMDLQSVLFAIENNGITRNGRTVEEFLSELLQSPMVGRGADEAEAREIQRVIENIIQTLAFKLEETDPNLKCTVLHAGSTSEGTKTRYPNEFDFMVCLETLSDLVEIEFPTDSAKGRVQVTLECSDKSDDNDDCSDSDDSGVKDVTVSVSDYVYLKVKDEESAKPFMPILTVSGSMDIPRIPCCAMYEGFSDIIAKTLFNKDFPKDSRIIPLEVTPEPAIEFHWHGSRFKDMIINVDLVPALRLSRWPDRSRRDCRLLTGDMLSRHCLAVPKMTSGEDEDLWRCSLALLETNIFRLLQAGVRNTYIICKCLISSTILPVIHFEKDDEDFKLFKAYRPDLMKDDSIKIHEHAESIVPSYVLKMTFLSVLEERITQFGIAHVYNSDPSEEDNGMNSSDDHVDGTTEVSVDLESGYTDKIIDPKTADDVRYGPALRMYVPQRSTDFDITLVRDVFRECEKRLENKFVPSVFNHEHNVLGNRLLSGDIDKALVFIRIVNQLLT